MFTGIIQALGSIHALDCRDGDARLIIRANSFSTDQMSLGDSISVNGVCLTVTDFDDNQFCADVSRETLSRTTLTNLIVGSVVNLEKALMPLSRMGGHFVSGHIDGVGHLISKTRDGRSQCLQFEAPDSLPRYIAEKGSICIDGISLTVNKVDCARFEVNIVPHTLEATTLGGITTGQRVNLEVDLIARYLERLMLGQRAVDDINGSVDYGKLKNSGFL